ncbi:MAG: DUF4384 domain-containing protein [Acidobacteria bacterium]|nr:DUF4384 domain-containing protein [Acidobacteriota bacterium]
MIRAAAALALAAAAIAGAQSRTMGEGSHRMELILERLDGNTWHVIDPGLVLNQGDRVRFKFRTNFDGYLYVMNQSTSGKYEQLFPREDTGQQNRIAASQEYAVPATETAFRIAGPPGYEIVYWLVTPSRLADGVPRTTPPAPSTAPRPAPTLIPRCDDTVLKARGECVDSSAGPKLIPRGQQIPPHLTDPYGKGPSDLMFLRQKDTSVISSPEPLNGPVMYEFRLAHR